MNSDYPAPKHASGLRCITCAGQPVPGRVVRRDVSLWCPGCGGSAVARPSPFVRVLERYEVRAMVNAAMALPIDGGAAWIA